MSRSLSFTVAGVTAALALAVAATPASAAGSFIGGFSETSIIGSTVPANGDVNPYGVAVVRDTSGSLIAGDILVSNFNASSNLQGTGTTIVELSPNGNFSLFARIDPSHLPGPCPGGVGLTTALAILPDDYVVVGSLPTADGTSATAAAGCLLVLDNHGTVVETVAGRGINGPWDMTSTPTVTGAALFITNVLNDTVAASGSVVYKGTVERIDVATNRPGPPRFIRPAIIGSGFPERTDVNALVVGPTGLGLGPDGTLYVADSVNNRIAAISHATGRLTSAGTGLEVTVNGSLNDPLGLTIAPNGDIVTANGNDGLLVETTPQGSQVATFDTMFGGGSLFGLAVTSDRTGLYLVDDGNNTLTLAS